MKKVMAVILIFISVVLLCGTLTACTDDEQDNDPIIGTWLCESTEDYAVYYVEVSAKEGDDSHLNWAMYGSFVYETNPHNNRWREYRVTDLGINPKISGRYSLQSPFSGSSNALYQVDMAGDNAFEVKGDQVAVDNKKYEFKRTELTLDQFKEQYWDRLAITQ